MGEAKRRRESMTASPERIDVIRGAQRCAWCRTRVTVVHVVERRGPAQAFHPGTVVVCHTCLGPCWTNERRQLVKLDGSIRAAFDLADLARIDATIEQLRAMKRARGETVGGKPA
jgi:hypothetical protein